MDILYVLVPLSVVLVFLIGGVFWWSLRHNQFDDLEGPGYRILMDDDRPRVEDAASCRPASADLPKRSVKSDPRHP